MPQLDALRFGAVFLVMLEHWLPRTRTNEYLLGPSGVIFFFVLSGFLITKILITDRLNAEANGVSNRMVIIKFYFRRMLRIFPIYYLFLFTVMVIPGIGGQIRHHAPWYLAYLNNFHIYRVRDWGPIGHTWTLAVEEQFYMIWPFVVVFVCKTKLLRLFTLLILLAIVSRTIFFYLARRSGLGDINEGYEGVLTPFYFDAFGLGALLAYQQTIGLCGNDRLRKLFAWLLTVSCGGWLIVLCRQDARLMYFGFHISMAVISVGIIFFASTGFSGITKKILESRGLVYLGRISYGLYLYHYVCPVGFNMLSKNGIFLPDAPVALRFAIYLLATIIVASLSWYVIEQPILRIKRRFKVETAG